MHFLVEMPAVLGFEYPMPRVRPHEQAAGHVHALQRRPVLERVAERHTIVALADAEQNRRLPVRGIRNRTLLAPDRIAGPGRPAVHDLAFVDEIALAPLRGEVDLARMAHDALIARARRLDPVRQVSAIARARGAHSRTIDEGIALQGLVDRLVDLL